MIAKHCISSFFKPLIMAVVLAMASSVHGAGTAERDAVHDPWAFNLTLYMWFPGLNGDFSAGPLTESLDLSIIDIAGKLRSFPVALVWIM